MDKTEYNSWEKVKNPIIIIKVIDICPKWDIIKSNGHMLITNNEEEIIYVWKIWNGKK